MAYSKVNMRGLLRPAIDIQSAAASSPTNVSQLPQSSSTANGRLWFTSPRTATDAFLICVKRMRRRPFDGLGASGVAVTQVESFVAPVGWVVRLIPAEPQGTLRLVEGGLQQQERRS